LAYLKNGYPQIEIANYLGLFKSAISMVVKSGKVEVERQGCFSISMRGFFGILFPFEDISIELLTIAFS